MAALRKRHVNKQKDVDLESMVQSGPSGAYEALQLYRSRVARLKSKSDFLEAVKSCVSGASVLLENGYENAGAELATLLIDLLVEDNTPLTDELRAYLLQVENKFPAKSSHRTDFLKSAIKWTIATGTKEFGDAALHQRLALSLWENGDQRNAAYHFAAGEAPVVFLDEIAKLDSQEARVRTLTMAVVNFLALENLRDAHEIFKQASQRNVVSNANNDNGLLNFCDFLLQVSRRDAAPLFKSLVNAYASQLDFDESVPTLLMGPVASRLFGIKPKVNPMMSMLQSMMS